MTLSSGQRGRTFCRPEYSAQRVGSQGHTNSKVTETRLQVVDIFHPASEITLRGRIALAGWQNGRKESRAGQGPERREGISTASRHFPADTRAPQVAPQLQPLSLRGGPSFPHPHPPNVLRGKAGTREVSHPYREFQVGGRKSE